LISYLVLYGEPMPGKREIGDSEERKMVNYSEQDEWSSGAWLTAGENSAVILVGTKAIGNSWYGFSNELLIQQAAIQMRRILKLHHCLTMIVDGGPRISQPRSCSLFPPRLALSQSEYWRFGIPSAMPHSPWMITAMIPASNMNEPKVNFLV